MCRLSRSLCVDDLDYLSGAWNLPNEPGHSSAFSHLRGLVISGAALPES